MAHNRGIIDGVRGRQQSDWTRGFFERPLGIPTETANRRASTNRRKPEVVTERDTLTTTHRRRTNAHHSHGGALQTPRAETSGVRTAPSVRRGARAEPTARVGTSRGISVGVVPSARVSTTGNDGAVTPSQRVQAPAAASASQRGLVVRNGGMTICSDGAPGVTTSARQAAQKGLIHDPNYNPRTAMSWGGGRPVDASRIPYVVIPGNGIPGVRKGDLVRVTANGRTAYAIAAEVGPRDAPGRIHGEGSMRLAQMLGLPSSPTSGTTRSGVTYEFAPGSGAAHGIRNGGRAFTEAEIQTIGATVFTPR